MSIWAGVIGTIVGPITELVNSLHTSDEERLRLQNELQKIVRDAELETQRIEAAFEQEITKRHQADMSSDSRLSKNVRPAILIFLTSIFAILSLTDGTIQIGEYVFTVKEQYIPVYETLLITAFAFYFSSRGLEKSAKIWGLRKKEKDEE